MKRLVVRTRAAVLVMGVCALLLLGTVASFVVEGSAWDRSSVAGSAWDSVKPDATSAQVAASSWNNVKPIGTDSSGWG